METVEVVKVEKKHKCRTDTKGIYKTYNNKFRPQIRFNGMLYNLGTFDTMEEAIRAKEKKLIEVYGESMTKPKKTKIILNMSKPM